MHLMRSYKAKEMTAAVYCNKKVSGGVEVEVKIFLVNLIYYIYFVVLSPWHEPLKGAN